MPLYDFDCHGCGEMHTELIGIKAYDDVDEVECEHCGTRLTKKDRIISGDIKARIIGVSKGNFNSGDYT